MAKEPLGPVSEDTIAATIDSVSVTRFLETKNLSYMLYTTQERALPSVLSGVKPGAQRLLWSMHQDKVLPGTKPRKSAKLTSAATGAYHPHGQSSMYGTLATLAQTYSRVSLIEGIGAFGIAPGDEPAADRYTESRLSPAGYAMVEEVAKGAVPMKPTYDGENMEPVYLPARFPALLSLGAVGIGEGWSTTFPQHNPIEAINAALLLHDNPDATIDDILDVMPGPDWGTGGEVVGSKAGIREYMDTGRGHLTVRGTVVTSKSGFTIVEVPPGVSVSTLLDGTGKGKNPQPGLRDLARQGVISGISDVSDLTDLENGLRIEVKVKRGYKVDEVLTEVLRATELETTFAASLVALDPDFVPRWWTLREVLEEFLASRDSAVLNRSRKSLETLESRTARAEAIVKVVLDKDATVAILRGADDKAAAITGLAEHFSMTQEQATYIAEMPLYRLTKADTLEAQAKLDELNAEVSRTRELVDSPEARHVVIRKELEETLEMFPAEEYARRTQISHEVSPVSGDRELSDSEKLMMWKLDTETFGLGERGEDIPEGSSVWTAFTDGKVRRFDGKGLPKRITLKPVAPQVDRVFATGVYDPKVSHILLVTAGLNKSATAKALRLDTSEMNPQGISGNGVSGIKLTGDDRLVAAMVVTDDDVLLTVSESGWKATPVADIPVKGAGSQGVGIHTLTKDDGGVMMAAVGSGFTVNGAEATPTKRGGTPKREPVDSWEVK